jgi:hypothetical protein
MEIANREQAAKEEESRKLLEAQGEPEFGERIEPTVSAVDDADDAKKPARRATKKSVD